MNTPILFLTFNRLDTTKQVFEEIRKAKPPRLYLASDGARQNVDGETEKVQAVRDYILSRIDWECEVKTLFRDTNLGCKYAVSGAITCFFENEEIGIILEDDCLPDQSFFPFCEELLTRYKEDKRVWHISGDNFQNGTKWGDGDYYFSKYNHVWGWASWRDRWDQYDVEMTDYETTIYSIKHYFANSKEFRYWKQIFSNVYMGKTNTWDYQYTFSMWKNSGIAIVPNVNLISNIGFGEGATHTQSMSSPHANMISESLPLPIKAPKLYEIAVEADTITTMLFFRPPSQLLQLRQMIKSILIRTGFMK